MSGRSGFVRRVCVGCGAAALVDAEALVEPYRCTDCADADATVAPEELSDVRLSRFWTENRGNAGMSGAFAALDEVFNPAAARAQEQVKGDHERVVPKPSPGDDALRTGSLVIRVERPPADDDV